MTSRLLLAALCFALGALAGCAPTTPYRYTAFVPSARPIPWDGRAAKAGTLRVEGTIAGSNVETNDAPQLHDTALLVPQWTVGGSAALAITSEIEVGVRFDYASYAWRQESAAGTLPLPSRPATWSVGPELRMAIPLDEDRRFMLGVAANLVRAEVPFAEWTLTGPGSPNGAATPCTPSATCTGGYSLFDERSESHLIYSFGVYPSLAFGDHGEYGHAFALLGGTNGFKNDGFTDHPTNGSTVDVIGPVWLVGGGYGISVDSFRVAAMGFWPVTDSSSAVNYGMGFQLTIGANLPLWSRGDAPD
jgi:hypothetical protein